MTQFALLCVLATAGIVGYALRYARAHAAAPASSVPATNTQDDALAAILGRPHVLFRSTEMNRTYRKIMAVALDAPDGASYEASPECDVVYGARDGGICLTSVHNVFPEFTYIDFGGDFGVRHQITFSGMPSRARISPDGRIAAITSFVAGDSYSTAGFSTRCLLIDRTTGLVLAQLEEFEVQKDGQPFKPIDANFWGVTFAGDNDLFYATLGSGSKALLVSARVSTRQASVIREGVECPSLSPDGTRIAFKSRIPTRDGPGWRIHVLELVTGAEVAINEKRSVDDQPEWFDNHELLYAVPQAVIGRFDVWIARADGTGEPRMFIRDAASPCVVRG